MFRRFGHLQVDELTKNKKHIYAVTFGMRLIYGGWWAGLLDGGTRSRVYCVGRGVYMGVYYANLSIVHFRAAYVCFL